MRILRITSVNFLLFLTVLVAVSYAKEHELPKNFEQSLRNSCEQNIPSQVHVRVYYNELEKWMISIVGWDKEDKILLNVKLSKGITLRGLYIPDERGEWKLSQQKEDIIKLKNTKRGAIELLKKCLAHK